MSGRGRLLAILGVGVIVLLVGVAIWEAHARHREAAEARRVLPVIVSYLERKDGPSRTSGGWSLFCNLRYLGNSPLGQHADLYVWEACQEYRARGQTLSKFTGWSVPAVISVVRTANGYRPSAEHQPVEWPQDVRRMFPPRVQAQIFGMDGGLDVAAMFAALDRRARRELLRR